jgi:hypothetical protein
VSSGPFGGAVLAQAEIGQHTLAILTDAFGKDTRGKSRETVSELASAYFGSIPEGQELPYLQLFCAYVANLRDVRDGKGERDLAYWAYLELALRYPVLGEKLLHYFVSEIGSYGDLHRFLDQLDDERFVSIKDSFTSQVTDVFSSQLKSDMSALSGDKVGISLASKHAPRERKATTDRGRTRIRLVYAVATKMFLDDFEDEDKSKHLTSNGILKPSAMRVALSRYRKMLTSLNNHLKVTENIMCNGAWADIDPSCVSAMALRNYAKAFANKQKVPSEDPDRIACAQNFASVTQKAIETGEGLHGTVAGAHAIVKPFVQDRLYEDDIHEGMFKNVTKETMSRLGSEGGIPPCIAVVDVSGSMSGPPIEVAIALGLLVSLTSHPAWRRMFITFHEEPTIQHVVGETLREMVSNIMSAPWGGSTNFAKALNLILTHAKTNKLPQDAMPKVLFVFSDMQFNEAENGGSYYGSSYYRSSAQAPSGLSHSHASIKAAYEAAGYECPHIVFWNLRGEVGDSPCETISEGVSQMSGFSQQMLKAFTEGKMMDMANETPCDRMLAVLNDDRYNRIRELVKEHFNP